MMNKYYQIFKINNNWGYELSNFEYISFVVGYRFQENFKYVNLFDQIYLKK